MKTFIPMLAGMAGAIAGGLISNATQDDMPAADVSLGAFAGLLVGLVAEDALTARKRD